MAQQPAPPQETEKDAEQNYLETVIDCITQRNETRLSIEDGGINQLYGKASTMIKDLDTGINRCKKYNEAKINRKYEIIINDLQAEIKRLQESLKLQQDARSPTKKHVSDILEKLVQLRSDNEELQKDNQILKGKIKMLEDQIDTQTSALNKIQSQQMKTTIERLPPLSNSPSLAETVKEFLKDKQHVRKITRQPVTKFQKFIAQLRPKLWNWNVGNLLEQVDKWAQGIKEKQGGEVDMWRIRSSIARKFSDYMDNPRNLLLPSSSLRSEESVWQKLQKKNVHSAKFSYLGSKRSLNASFH